MLSANKAIASFSDSLILQLLANVNRPFSTEPVVKTDSLVCKLPFSRAGNLMLVRAKVDTIEGNFILDTGAPGLVLNITYFRNYTLTYSTDEEQGGVAGSSSGVPRTSINKFQLGGFHYSKFEADLVSLANIERNKNLKILGLIGMQLLKQCEMLVDYENNYVTLRYIAKKDNANLKNALFNDTSLYHVFPIELNDNKVILKSELAGKKLRLLVDCAAESNVLDSRLPDRIFEQITINQRVVLSGAGNTKVDAIYGDLQSLKIGNQEYSNLSVLVTNLEKTCLSYGGCIDGILGFDFLSQHKIGFNFVNNKMYIWK